MSLINCQHKRFQSKACFRVRKTTYLVGRERTSSEVEFRTENYRTESNGPKIRKFHISEAPRNIWDLLANRQVHTTKSGHGAMEKLPHRALKVTEFESRKSLSAYRRGKAAYINPSPEICASFMHLIRPFVKCIL